MKVIYKIKTMLRLYKNLLKILFKLYKLCRILKYFIKEFMLVLKIIVYIVNEYWSYFLFNIYI